MCGDEGISAFPKDDNLFEWLGTIHGSAGTVYEGLEYKISLKFGSKYPNEPPQASSIARPASTALLLTSLNSANLPRACFTPTWMRKAVTSASISSLPTNGLPFWTYDARIVAAPCTSCHLFNSAQVRALLVSLRSLLSEPNNDSPLNNQAALL